MEILHSIQPSTYTLNWIVLDKLGDNGQSILF